MDIVRFDFLEFNTCGTTTMVPHYTYTMETTMNPNPMTVDHTLTARNALATALVSLECKVDEKAYDTFHLRDEVRPETAQELVDRIKADEYILPDTEDDDYDESDYRYDAFRGLRFKPRHKKDREGYEKHMKEFRISRNALRLEIQVLEPEKALANFKKLEKEYLH